MKYTTSFVTSINAIPAPAWQALASSAGPFLQYPLLSAMENTDCVGEGTGWHPYFLLVHHKSKLIAAMPGYLKADSYGEYVFDHGWAHAYEQHGLDYYPKWISAIPFTPVTGPRLLVADGYNADDLLPTIRASLNTLLNDGVSSLHILFSPQADSPSWQQNGFARRYSVQFQWYNYGYETEDDFTAALTSRKRRSLRKSRQKLDAAGVTIQRIKGAELTDDDIQFFILCYQQTYLKRSGHSGYLTPDFFESIFRTMADHTLLVKASRNGKPVASALFFYDAQGLYGRYWGSLQDIDGLHFESCYNQGIAFAIEHGLPLFNPGTQGEHKILRGFEPTFCVSLHHLFDNRFHSAVEEFLHQETPQISHYFQQAATVLPFNEAMTNKLKTTSTAAVTPDAAITTKRNDNEV
ncbi:GNAT family N-acetyltransferase [Alteromonas confluentis]|uniref:GNAT family N-acetyltransferase n=1 Tax=Alteromonas confluentis TaxID=1656094 RepID=A0A1E7Z6V2_9ALTE|nr:GNAT family N-acetyltransferase [Alteromonas confluentis]OFC69258.1 GNAT family N-acetyltransferase [Alteromonas confluentis]